MFVDFSVSLTYLKVQGLKLVNVCSNLTWEGFLTKPKAYLSYLSKEDSNSYALVVDSDVIFNNLTDADKLWDKYFGIVGKSGKDLVIST